MPWQRSGPAQPEDVDRLFTVAEDVAMREGASPAAVQAARVAIDAARALAARTGTREDRGRLLRALGRQAVNRALTGSGRVAGSGSPVEQVVALAHELLAEPVTDGTDDPVRAEALIRLGQASQIVAATDPVRGRELAEQAWLALGSDPPAGSELRRARAAILSVRVQNQLADVIEGLGAGRPVDLDGPLALAAEGVDLQRAVGLADGADTSLYDLAEALGTLGRAALAAQNLELASQAWAEELSILMSFDGPAARKLFTEVAGRLGKLQELAPQLQVVVPGPNAWRSTSSYLDRLPRPGPGNSPGSPR